MSSIMFLNSSYISVLMISQVDVVVVQPALFFKVQVTPVHEQKLLTFTSSSEGRTLPLKNLYDNFVLTHVIMSSSKFRLCKKKILFF